MKRRQDLLGQGTGTCAKFPHLICTGGLQCLRDLAGQGVAKQGADLGRGHKVAARRAVLAARHRAKFRQVGGVVAHARCVQRLFHKGVKTHPTTLRAEGIGNVLL